MKLFYKTNKYVNTWISQSLTHYTVHIKFDCILCQTEPCSKYYVIIMRQLLSAKISEPISVNCRGRGRGRITRCRCRCSHSRCCSRLSRRRRYCCYWTGERKFNVLIKKKFEFFFFALMLNLTWNWLLDFH